MEHGIRHAFVLVLGLLALSVLGQWACSFDDTGIKEKLSCQRNDDCLDGWRCTGEGRCVPAITRGQEDAGTRSDLGESPGDADPATEDGASRPADGGPQQRDLGSREDIPGPERDTGGPERDTGGLTRDLGHEDEDAAGTDMGEPPEDTGARGPGCLGELICSVEQVCNEYGHCVPAHGDPRYCEPCTEDGQCGSPQGVCFNSNYEGQASPEGHCLSSCLDDEACPQGMSCYFYARLGSPAGVCAPSVTSCVAWRGYGEGCLLSSDCPDDSFCARPMDGWFCTYTCWQNEECPPGARCDDPWYRDGRCQDE